MSRGWWGWQFWNNTHRRGKVIQENGLERQRQDATWLKEISSSRRFRASLPRAAVYCLYVNKNNTLSSLCISLLFILFSVSPIAELSVCMKFKPFVFCFRYYFNY